MSKFDGKRHAPYVGSRCDAAYESDEWERSHSILERRFALFKISLHNYLKFRPKNVQDKEFSFLLFGPGAIKKNRVNHECAMCET